MPGTSPQTATGFREFLPPGTKRKERTEEQIKAAAETRLDYAATKVGVVGNITVYYDPSLGKQGLDLATQMLNFVIDPYVDMEAFFGISGGAISVVIAPLSGNNDGSGGAYHYGCDFSSGGTLYLDATFANTTAPPFSIEVALYIAELSECFMGQQNKGWGCGSSNGEALSRFCAEQTPPGTMPSWGITGPSWAQANYPDWVNNTEATDRDYASIGCGTVYLYWMCSKGYGVPQIVQAGGATLADNYKTLTGKTTAYNDLVAAAKAVTVKTDDPFPARAAGWNLNDLTAAAKAPLVAGKPDGYMFDAQGTQHVNYRDDKGHIQELWWDGAGWHNGDLTAMAKAPAAAGNPTGYMFDAQGTQHVDYRDVNGHIQELYWDGSWHVNNLTSAAKAPAAAGDPTGYMFDAQGTQHVDYRDANGHIQELWWDGSWHVNDLTAAAKAPLAASDPTGYVFDAQGTQHVDYRDVNGHIQELWWDGSWHVNDLTAAAKAPEATGKPDAYVFNLQVTQHVNYRDVNGHIQELWWDGSWHVNDLTVAAKAPIAAGDPTGYMYDDQGTQHVDYRDANGQIQELWWDSSGWHNNDLSADTKAPSAVSNPAGYMFFAQYTQHVVYQGTDNHIHELWWG